MFSWFDTNEAVRFGIKLADDYSADIDKANKLSSKKELLSKDKALQKMAVHVSQFRKTNQLNFYKKSKIVNEFRWRLIDVGCEEELVEAAIKELLIFLN